MSSMCVVLAVLAGDNSDPLAKFNANKLAIRVSMDFEYRWGRLEAHWITSRKIWFAQRVQLLDNQPLRAQLGRWDSDGVREKLFTRNSDAAMRDYERLKKKNSTKRSFSSSYFGRLDYLTDGDILAERGNSKASIFVRPTHEMSAAAVGPFRLFHGAVPEDFMKCGRKPLTFKTVSEEIAGLPLDFLVAAYHDKGTWPGWPNGVHHLYTIGFDPSLGHLIRWIRHVGGTRESASVVEFHLASAFAGKSGYFVPQEFVEIEYSLDHLDAEPSELDPLIAFDNIPEKVTAYHFRATAIRDGAPQLYFAGGPILRIRTPGGGKVELSPPVAKLNLDGIRKRTGRKIYEPPPTRPSPRVTVEAQRLEAQKYDYQRLAAESQRGFTLQQFILAAVALVALGFLAGWFWHRRRTVLPLALFLFAMPIGCANSTVPGKPVLWARFQEPFVIQNADGTNTPLTLIIGNQGNAAITLNEVKPSCICSVVETPNLPITLEPGSQVVVKVASHIRDYEMQRLGFTFETDLGSIGTAAEVFLVPQYRILPQSLYATFRQGEKHEMSFTYRQTGWTDKDFTPIALTQAEEFPEVSISLGDESRGEGPAPGQVYREIPIQMTIESSLAMKKTTRLSVVEKSAPERKLAVCTVEWKCRPAAYLIPEKIYLGKQTIRAFLICEDDSVEISDADCNVEDVNVVVASPRMLLIHPASDPREIEGKIKVHTTSPDASEVSVDLVCVR